MKKLMVLAAMICLVAVLGATAGVVSWNAPSTGVPAAKTAYAVADAIALGKNHLLNHNILAARDAFKQAVTEAPENQEANFLYGITRVFAVWEQGYGTTAGLDSVREIMERSGFSFTVFGLYNTVGTDPQGIAAGTPSTGAVIDFVKTRLLPEVDGAIANLAKVTGTSFASSISAEALGATGEGLSADYADALAVKALLYALKCNLNLLVVYGPDVRIPDVAAAPDQLTTYKALFADSTFLAPKETSRIATARQALVDFIDTFNAAALRLQARPGVGQHLFVVDVPWDQVGNEPIDTSSASLAEATQALALVKASLSGAQTFPGSGPVQDRTIDLSRFFNSASPISIRESLSDCAGGLAFPDPTFKGLFPLGVSVHDKAVAEMGPYVLGVTCADKGAPLVSLEDDGLWFEGAGTPAKPVYLYNRGTGPLTVAAVGFAGEDPSAFTVQKGTCPSLTPTLSAGASCSLMVGLDASQPGSGYVSAELVVVSDDPGRPTASTRAQGYLQPAMGGAVNGTVVDAATGAGVQSTIYFSGPDWRSLTTDANGAYSVSGLATGSYNVSVYPWDSAYASVNTSVRLTSAPLTVPPIAVSKGVTLSGRVKDAATGAGVGGLWIQLFRGDSEYQVSSASTDNNGDYSFKVAPGSYRIKVYGGDSGFASQWYKGGAAVTVAGTPVTLDDILLAKGGAISGKLTDAVSGLPVANHYVHIHDASSGDYLTSGLTDATGVYLVAGLPNGSYKVDFGSDSTYYSIWYPNAASRSQGAAVNVTAPNTTGGINGSLKRGGSISGRVTDERGNPLSYTGVSAEAGNQGEEEWANTDYDGNYTITGLAPGSYRVEFEGRDNGYVPQYYKDGYYSDEYQPVQVTASATTGGVDAALSRGGSISGKVTDASGAPISDVEVLVYDKNGNEIYDASTEPDGSYSVGGLPTGSYKVRFMGYEQGYVETYYGGAARLAEAALVKVYAPLAVTQIDASPVQGKSISGAVTDAAGTPIADAGVHVFNEEGLWVSDSRTDAQGKFHAGGLPAGNFKIFADKEEGPLLAGQWYNGKASYAAATAVTVGSADVAGIDMKLSTGATLISPTMAADLGKVPTGATDSFRIIEIYNLGSQNLVLGTVSVTGANASEFTLSHDLCSGRSMPARESGCSVRISFSPTSQAAKSAVLNVPYNAAGTTVLNIGLSGTGVGALPAGYTTTSLVSSANPSSQGQSVTFTATVAPVGSGAVPTGSVTFKDGSAVLGSASLNTAGKASFATSSLTAGSHNVTAIYAGSTSYNGSTSAALSQTVRPPQATLSVTVNGTGSVHSAPTGIACQSGSGAGCSASFAGGTSVTLTPTASANFAFSGWSGACSGTGACQVVMDGAKGVGASFAANPATVRIADSATPYYAVGAALDAVAAAGKTVRARDLTFVEHVVMDNPLAIVLGGGYTDLAAGTRGGGFTYLDGSLRIRSGTLRVDRVKLR